MTHDNPAELFNEIYDATAQKTLCFITAKCSVVSDAADIFQDTYAEVYSVVLKRGLNYIENPEAFVIKIARQKLWRYYSLREKKDMKEKELIAKAMSDDMPDLEAVRKSCMSRAPAKKPRFSTGKKIAAAAACLAVALGVTAALTGLHSRNVSYHIVTSDGDIYTSIAINKLNEISTTSLDADLKQVSKEEISDWNFDFVGRIKVPQELNEISYSEIYTRGSVNDDYTILHDYAISYQYTNSEDLAEKYVNINFSKDFTPLRDCYIEDEDGNKISTIGDTEVQIFNYDDFYMAFFSCNGVNFDIEALGITQEEFINLLVSIIYK